MIAMGWVVNLMQRGSASFERICQILNERPTIAEPASAPPLTAVRGEIEFRGVSVVYPAGPAPVVDFANPRRCHCGDRRRHWLRQKHAGEPDPSSPRPPPARSSWTAPTCALFLHRRCAVTIGFVPQETFLFSSTIAENIAFGVEKAPEQIRRAPSWRTGADIESFQPDTDDGRRARHHLSPAVQKTAHGDRPCPAAAIRASPHPR